MSIAFISVLATASTLLVVSILAAIWVAYITRKNDNNISQYVNDLERYANSAPTQEFGWSVPSSESDIVNTHISNT